MVKTAYWDPYIVSLKRKAGFVMLIAAVLWTAMPASACVPVPCSMGQLACCSRMVQECPAAGMTANDSCCNIDGQIPVVSPAPFYSSDHSQRSVLAEHCLFLPAAFAPHAAQRNSIETSPPKLDRYLLLKEFRI